MNDTSKEMPEKQMDIIVPEQPNWSELEIVAEIFKRYYRNEFPESELNTIANSIKAKNC